jgi:hypothetical protein
VERKVRISFLPLFLICVIAGFGVAVAMRVREYSAAAKGGSTSTSAAVADHAAAEAPDVSRGAENAVTEEDLNSGVIVSVKGSQSAQQQGTQVVSNATGNRTVSASRAQRYNELLSQPVAAAPATGQVRTPPPPAQHVIKQPPPPPVKQPNLIQRLVGPVKSALGFGSDNASVGPTTTTTTSTEGAEKPKSNDPTSDVTPPQLLGVVFDPLEVSDGSASMVVITATDDISGVGSISGTITSPSGKALQGFSVQKDPEIPNRFLGKVQIPLKAEEGLWRVNFLSLRDNASNTANLHYNQGSIPASAALRVNSSQGDSTPPTLRRIYLDRRTMKANEKNTVFIEADDDKSGVKFASGSFYSPAHFARISFGCQKQETDTQWVCAMNTPEKVDCGDWKLEQVQLSDNANNMTTVRADNQLVAAITLNIYADNITDCDHTQPTLEALTVDQRVVTNNPGSAVMLTASVNDDLSGVNQVMAQCTGPGQGSGQWFSFAVSGESPNIYVGRFDIPKDAGKGIWRVAFIQVIDKAGNTKLYSSNDALLKRVTFEVK